MSDLKVDQVLQIYEIETDVALKYGIDLNSRVIQLVGEINDMAFCHIDTALTLMEAKGRSAVTIRIHSPGGSVYSALAIISRIRSSKCQIITEAYGSCMSAATLILAAGKKRRMGAAAIVMHHEAAYEIGGTHTQVKHVAKQVEREEALWCGLMEEYTGTSASIWSERGRLGEDWYLDAEECKELGIVDEIF
jgi:ATP-dependent Clp protease protease subunit